MWIHSSHQLWAELSPACAGTQNDFLGYRGGIGAFSCWFHLWDMEIRVEAFPHNEFSWVESFYTPPGSQQSPEVAEVTDGVHHILPNADHQHGHLPLPVGASKLTQAQKTGFCQHA